MSFRDLHETVGVLIIVLGAICAIAMLGDPQPISAGTSVVLILIGISLAFRRTIVSKIGWGRDKYVEFEPSLSTTTSVPTKRLPQSLKQRRVAYAQQNPPPAYNAPAFNALTDVPDIGAFPGVDPMVPMYILDRNFRILDWNEAFSLAFDRTMEGRRGQSAIEWVYFLDNFKRVLEHGKEVFSDPDDLPAFDKEELHYSGTGFGKIVATKRAYRVPDETSEYAAWLIMLDLDFQDPACRQRYDFELTRMLSRRYLWSEYSLSYDQVLQASPLYQQLIAKVIGEEGRFSPIPPEARVLDLGAGTGNIAEVLARGGRTVFCIDNNATMLNILRRKCRGCPLRRDDGGPGVIALKQDVSSLFGLQDDYFDVAIANNVLYTLPDPEPCLREVYRVLKPQGEIRISGPRRNFNLGRLFKHLRKDLIRLGKLQEVGESFERALRANLVLEPDLRSWAERDLDSLLKSVGFTGIEGDDTFYRGNGRVVTSTKR